MNITKIQNGFKIDGLTSTYMFKNNEYEILAENECHIVTDLGTIFFDASVTIDNISFQTIEEWIAEIYK